MSESTNVEMVNGEMLTRKQASKMYQINYNTLTTRVCKYGMTLEEAVNTPVMRKKRNKGKHKKHGKNLVDSEINEQRKRIQKALRDNWSMPVVYFGNNTCTR